MHFVLMVGHVQEQADVIRSKSKCALCCAAAFSNTHSANPHGSITESMGVCDMFLLSDPGTESMVFTESMGISLLYPCSR